MLGKTRRTCSAKRTTRFTQLLSQGIETRGALSLSPGRPFWSGSLFLECAISVRPLRRCNFTPFGCRVRERG